MFAKNLLKMSAVAVVASAGVAAADVSIVTCDGFIITINEEQTMKIKETTGDDPAFSDAVCEVGGQLNLTEYQTPTQVRVTLSNGNEYDVNVQADSKAKR